MSPESTNLDASEVIKDCLDAEQRKKAFETAQAGFSSPISI